MVHYESNNESDGANKELIMEASKKISKDEKCLNKNYISKY